MNKLVKIVLICIAICFLVPIVFTLITIFNDNKKTDIISNGTKTTATVVDYEYKMTIHGVDYYALNYEFSDENGIFHTGTSGANFEYYEAISTTDLTVFYNENYQSVEEKYEIDTIKYITIGVFSLTEIIIWVIFIALYIKNKKKQN